MDELRAGTPLVVGNITIVPISHILIQAYNGCLGQWTTALKEPHAVVLCEAGRIHAISAFGAEIALEDLSESVPKLDVLLESLQYLRHQRP